MPDVKSPTTQMGVPYNIDAEEAVIGSILIDSECIDEVTLSPDDFFSDRSRLIYIVAKDMRSSGIPTNQVTVAESLMSRQRSNTTWLDLAGGAAYLSHCISITPTSLDVVYYAKIIKKCAFYRGLIVCASQIAGLAADQDENTGLTLDKAETYLKELRTNTTLVSRTLELGQPRLMQTNPPNYIWNVNGKDLRLTLVEITKWGTFKNKVISELNFVPIAPKDWDTTINKLLVTSTQIEAPADASDEQQLKIIILKWFGKMHEASVYSELQIGRHVIRDFNGMSHYCFQSTPLLKYLRDDHKRIISSGAMWVSIEKWGAIRRSVRIKKDDTGSMSTWCWCLPFSFVEGEQKINIPADF